MIYVTLYTREQGKQEFTLKQWKEFHNERGIILMSQGLSSPFLMSSPLLPTYHRVDGPAIEFSNKEREWWIDDKRYPIEEFNKIIEEVENMPVELRLTDPRWWVREWK